MPGGKKNPNTSDALHQLIHSLTKSEKRYFKLYVSAFREQSGLMSLYGFLEKQEVYNEAEVKGFFKSQPGHHQLHVVKYNLMKLILKAMRNYQSDQDVTNMLDAAHLDIRFLLQKGLYKEGEQLILRFYKKAIAGETFSRALSFLNWQLNIIYTHTKFKDVPKKYDRIHKDFIRVLNMYQNFILFNQILVQLSHLVTKEGPFVRNKNKQEQVRKILSNPLLSSPDNALSVRAKITYHVIYDAYHTLKGDKEKIYYYRSKIVEGRKYLANTIRSEKETRGYLTSLGNLLSIELSLGKRKDFFQTLGKIKDIPELSAWIKRTKIFNYYIYLLTYYNWTGQMDKALKSAEEYEKNYPEVIKQYTDIQELEVNFTIACTYFTAQQYENAQRYMNRVLKQIKSNIREDIMGIIKLLEIVMHIEQNNTRLVDSLAESAYVYLSKKQKLMDFEKVILKFTKKYLSLTGSRGLTPIWKETHQNLIKLRNNQAERSAFGYFDIISWLESKIQQKPFKQILKEKGDKNLLNWIG